MNLTDLKNKKIAILGYGIEGQVVAKYLQAHSLPFDVLDERTDSDYLKKVGNYEIVFRSPGVKFFPEIVAARQAGTIITSQLKYFFENCAGKIIGVTGTKGKGTTTQLIYEILQRAGIKSYVGGNLGNGVLEFMEQVGPEDYVVLEMSSFQLQDFERSPHIAVVLMVTEEHLDYHLNVQEYVAAKAPITKFQEADDFAIVNIDFEASKMIGVLGKAKKYYVRTLGGSKADFQDGVLADSVTGEIYLITNGKPQLFLKASELLLPGYHNVQNIGSAILAAKIAGASADVIRETVKNFKGLEHRLELVAEKEGIKFYNDSFGTTPETCLAAVRAFKQPEIVIVGGYDKKGDYARMGKELAAQNNIKAAVLIGQIAPALEAHLKKHKFSGQIIHGGATMQEIVAKAYEAAEIGDIVLLAPGTSSFDMFKNYKERGAQFKAAVRGL